MSILTLKNFIRVVKHVLEVACISVAVSLLGFFAWTGVTLHGGMAPLAVGLTCWLLFTVRAAIQQKILTGSFFTSSCPTSTTFQKLMLGTTIVTQFAAIALAAALFPVLFAVSGVVGYLLVALFAFGGAVLSNIPNKWLAAKVSSASN
ncbi:MAG: hypothetical protein P4L53_14395 [Candidatus Obscuribacterales bacterium]|nr:hypothetical protein [Candidatus Obscuribacterales bacterium]